jgi:hypothetical protein
MTMRLRGTWTKRHLSQNAAVQAGKPVQISPETRFSGARRVICGDASRSVLVEKSSLFFLGNVLFYSSVSIECILEVFDTRGHAESETGEILKFVN